MNQPQAIGLASGIPESLRVLNLEDVDLEVAVAVALKRDLLSPSGDQPVRGLLRGRKLSTEHSCWQFQAYRD